VAQREDEAWGATVTVDPRHRFDGYILANDVEAARRRLERVGVPPLPPPVRFRHPVREFVDKYGWRAYALPVLVVLTVLALVTAGGTPAGTGERRTAHAGAGTSAPPVARSDISLPSDATSAQARATALKAFALPPGPAYTERGLGTFRVLPGHTKVVGHGRLFRFDIEVENGITGVDLAEYQRLVVSTLDDPRSWSGHGVALQRVDSGFVDFHVTLTSAMTTRKFCGYTIPVETSCYAPAGSVSGLDVNRVVFNVARWVRGATAYIGDLQQYRIYMINHEDGHALGHEHAHQCLADGLAPTMMQQTFGLRSASTGKMCGANPWPYPPGAKDAPGAEQPDTPQNNEYGISD
jgi:hypothetical protein